MRNLRFVFLVFMISSLACRLPQAIQPSNNTPVATEGPVPPTPTTLWEPTLTPAAVQPEPVRDPIGSEHPLLKAEEAVFLGDWPSAIAAYQSALNSTTDQSIQAAAQAGLGRVYYLSGDAYNAQRILESLLEAQPDSELAPEAYFQLAQIHMDLARPVEAAQAYQGYLDTRPGVIDTYIHERRGDALQAAGDVSGALAAYQAAFNSPRLVPNLDLEIKIAQAYALAGDPATALIMYPDIYQRSEAEYQKARVDLLQGRLLASQGQMDQAYAAWLDAVNNFPTAYDAYQSLVELVNAGVLVDELQRGIVDYHAGEYGVALAALDRYLASASEDPAEAYYYRGLTMRAMEDAVSAVAVWDLMIQTYPESPMVDRAFEQKAYTQWAFLDLYPEASQTLLDFVASYPAHPRAAEFLFDAARIAERAADLLLASQIWQRVVSDYPASNLAYESAFQAGIADMRSNSFISAQTQFVRAQQLAGTPGENSRALFWSAKCYQALGDNGAALTTFHQTVQVDPTGYYSERARDLVEGRLPFQSPAVFDLGYDPVSERLEAETWMRSTFILPEETDFHDVSGLLQEPRLQRGLELWNLGESMLATAEIESLRLSLNNDPLNTFRLTQLLVEHRLFRPAIMAARQVLDQAGMDDATTMNAPKWFNRIRFGNYYSSLVIPGSQEFDFHPLFIWSVIRQESLFDASVRSSAGAQGLMQITAPTGQDIANQMGWPPNYTNSDLLRPQVSIRLGLHYLADQLDYLNGDIYAALAGYNAGPGNAAVWQGLAPEDKDLYLEVIRFSEPQRYIKGIYEIFSIYRKLYERTP